MTTQDEGDHDDVEPEETSDQKSRRMEAWAHWRKP